MKTRTKVTLDEILKTKTWLGSFLGPAQGSEGSLDFWRWRESEYSHRYFRVATASVVMSFCYNHDHGTASPCLAKQAGVHQAGAKRRSLKPVSSGSPRTAGGSR